MSTNIISSLGKQTNIALAIDSALGGASVYAAGEKKSLLLPQLQ